jgi:hypothetical protein
VAVAVAVDVAVGVVEAVTVGVVVGVSVGVCVGVLVGVCVGVLVGVAVAVAVAVTVGVGVGPLSELTTSPAELPDYHQTTAIRLPIVESSQSLLWWEMTMRYTGCSPLYT